MIIEKAFYWRFEDKQGIVRIDLKNMYDTNVPVEANYDSEIAKLEDERSHNLITIRTVSGSRLTVKELHLLLLKSPITQYIRKLVQETRRYGAWKPIGTDSSNKIIPSKLLYDPKYSDKYYLHWKIIEEIDRESRPHSDPGIEFYLGRLICSAKGPGDVYDVTNVWVRDLYDMLYFFNKVYPNLVCPDDTIYADEVTDKYNTIMFEFREPFGPNEGLRFISSIGHNEGTNDESDISRPKPKKIDEDWDTVNVPSSDVNVDEYDDDDDYYEGGHIHLTAEDLFGKVIKNNRKKNPGAQNNQEQNEPTERQFLAVMLTLIFIPVFFTIFPLNSVGVMIASLIIIIFFVVNNIRKKKVGRYRKTKRSSL